MTGGSIPERTITGELSSLIHSRGKVALWADHAGVTLFRLKK